MTIQRTLAQYVLDHRKILSLGDPPSQRECARRAKISNGTWSKIESGDTWDLTVELLSRVAEVLKVPAEEVFVAASVSREQAECGSSSNS